MHKLRVGVIRGGPSTEYDVSLKTGQSVLAHLPTDKYIGRDIFIDRSGTWHVRGMSVEPGRAIEQVDVIFNALHGAYGEDGGVQRVLDTYRIPYTGSGALGSSVSMNKVLTKYALRGVDMRFAPHLEIRRAHCSEETVRGIFHKLNPPYVVKPRDGGSSVGTRLVRSFDELLYAIMQSFEVADTILVEQYVSGREVTVGVIEGFRNEQLYALPPVLIQPTKSSFFDYDEKYAGHAREVCPAPLERSLTERLMHLAGTVHRTLGLRDYSRSDFIIGTHGIYFLEVNTLPGLTDRSLVPLSLDAVGATLGHMIDHVLTRALSRG